MKREIVVAAVISIFLVAGFFYFVFKEEISFSPGNFSCYDSESFSDIYNLGFINSSEGYFEDFCLNNSNLVRDYFCSNISVDFTDYACSNGCDGGACINSFINNSSVVNNSSLTLNNSINSSISNTSIVNNSNQPISNYTTGSIYATSSPSGLYVYVDKVRKGVTPLLISDVLLGQREIIIGGNGYCDTFKTINVSAGLTTNVNLSFYSGCSTNTGSVYVSSNPSGAYVFWEGHSYISGITPVYLSGISANEGESLAISMSGYNLTYKYLYLYPKQTLDVNINLQKLPTSNSSTSNSTNSSSGGSGGGSSNSTSQNNTQLNQSNCIQKYNVLSCNNSYLVSTNTSINCSTKSSSIYCTYGCENSSCKSQPICTSFNYTTWSSCLNGTQTRTVLFSSPNNCTGGNPVLSQSCTMPVVCTDSDGGLNYLVKGNVSVKNSSGEFIFIDSCGSKAGILKEYSCDLLNQLHIIEFSCANGCLYGKCAVKKAICTSPSVYPIAYHSSPCSSSACNSRGYEYVSCEKKLVSGYSWRFPVYNYREVCRKPTYTTECSSEVPKCAVGENISTNYC